MVRRRIYVAGKSGDSWYQISPSMRQNYKTILAKKYGSRCNPGFTLATSQGMDNKSPTFGCGKYFPIALLTVDHIIPISKGGPVLDIGNMQLLCWQCHRRKTTKNDMIEV
jgi:5-methylcytosine-specific restriction endonuclease McrA